MKNGKKLSITLQEGKTVIHAETPNFKTTVIKVKDRDKGLSVIAYLHHLTFWYNRNTDKFWYSIYNPNLRHHTNWREFEEHDFHTLLALGLIDRVKFNNPFPQKIRIRNKDKHKMRLILDRIEGKEAK